MSDRPTCLHPCPSCERHVRSSETACPFCEATLSGKCALPHAPAIGRVSSRAVLSFFAATAAIGACGKSQQTTIQEQPAITVYGPPPMAIDASAPVPPPPSDAGATRKDGER